MGKGDFSEVVREVVLRNGEPARKKVQEKLENHLAKHREKHAASGNGQHPQPPAINGSNSVADAHAVSQFPVLDNRALHGLAGRLVRLIEPQSEAHPAAMLIHLLLGFGNVIGRSPFFLTGGTEHHTNLFAAVVGKSSKARKGTSWAFVRSVFEMVDADWIINRALGGLSSGEGLIWAVRDAIYKAERNKKSGSVDEVLSDPGVEDKRLYVIESEFSQALRVMGRESNILSAVIRSAWDSGSLRTLVKNAPAHATGAHITICGQITQEELKKELGQCEFFNGFANRFLWVCAARSKLLPDGGSIQMDDFRSDIDELRQTIVLARSVREMKRDEAARKLWHDIYSELSEEGLGLVGAVTDRAEAQVLRLSMIYALLDKSVQIRLEHLEAARALWQYCEDSARYIFGDRLANPRAQKILDALRFRPEGMTRKHISEELFQRHATSEEIGLALSELQATGFVEMRLEQTGGRQAERWILRK